MITPANALKWSMWLAQNHPLAFKAVVRSLQGTAAAQLPQRPRSLGRYSFARGQFGYLGQEDGSDASVIGDLSAPSMETVTVEAPAPDLSATPLPDPSLADLNVTQPASVSFDLSGAASSTDTSGGFWSGIGSGLASLGSGVASAVGGVAKAVTNPQVLAGAAQVAASVINSNTLAQQRQAATALLSTQTQRTLTGAGAATVQWAVNPQTGARTPYTYNPATGQYQPTALAGLGGSGLASLSGYLPYILGGGLLLVLLLGFTRKSV